MARESTQSQNAMLFSEPYPLVMDAPLSDFDKDRIKTICEILPTIAEQMIIFINDKDEEIAEQYLASKTELKYIFDKKNEFETHLMEN